MKQVWLAVGVWALAWAVWATEPMDATNVSQTATPRFVLRIIQADEGLLYTIMDMQKGKPVAERMTARELELMFPPVWRRVQERDLAIKEQFVPSEPGTDPKRPAAPLVTGTGGIAHPSLVEDAPVAHETASTPLLSEVDDDTQTTDSTAATEDTGTGVQYRRPEQAVPPESKPEWGSPLAAEWTASSTEEPSMSELVNAAMAGAESAVTAAGLEYYGKDRTGMLGNRLWFADVGLVISSYSDSSADIDPGFVLATGWNIPLSNNHFDFSFGFAYMRQSGTILAYEYVPYTTYRYYYSYYYYYAVPTTRYRLQYYTTSYELSSFSANATMAFSLAPGKGVNPFILAGLYGVSQELTIGQYSASADDGGLIIGVGMELNLNKKTTLVPSVMHTRAGDIEETSVNALFAYWYAFRHALRLSLSYGTEYENTAVAGGIMYGF